MTDPLQELEFSRPVKLWPLDRQNRRQTLTASADECAAMAERFHLVSLANLKAELLFENVSTARRLIHMTGTITADAIQLCRLSGEEVNTPLHHTVDHYFCVNQPEPRFKAGQDLPKFAYQKPAVNQDSMEYIMSFGETPIGPSIFYL